MVGGRACGGKGGVRAGEMATEVGGTHPLNTRYLSNNDLPKFTHLLGFSLHGLWLSNRMKRNCRGTMLSGVREVGL